MKKRYKRTAYLLDDGILLHGYKDKRGFHPDQDLPCGFGTQKTRKRDINRTLFFSFKTAKEILGGNITVAGGNVFIGIDDGMACTRMSASIGDFVWMYSTETILSKENIHELIKDCTDKANITLAGNVDIHYRLSSENKNSTMGMCSKDACIIDIGGSTVDCIFVR